MTLFEQLQHGQEPNHDLELLDEHSPLKHWMHRLDAVIGVVVVVAAAYFVWSRVKVYKQYKAELKDIELWSATQRWLGFFAEERVAGDAHATLESEREGAHTQLL